MMSSYLGIFDWGIGGLGLYSAMQLRTNIPVLYFSDSGHTPYGKTPPAQLAARLDAICKFLTARGAEKIAIACNAANAAYSDRDGVSGIIAHGAKALKKGRWKNVGLIAGRGTVKSKIYEHRLKGSQISLHQRIAQPLSAHVEAGRLGGAQLHSDLDKILKPIANSDAILMACTHYPVIEKHIRTHINPNCQLVDPCPLMADWILDNWQIEKSTQPGVWYTTGDTTQFVTSGCRAYKVKIDNVNAVTGDLTCPV